MLSFVRFLLLLVMNRIHLRCFGTDILLICIRIRICIDIDGAPLLNTRVCVCVVSVTPKIFHYYDSYAYFGISIDKHLPRLLAPETGRHTATG